MLWLVGLLVATAVALGFRPRPVGVDTAEVVRGQLTVFVEEDGKTRVRERFVISAPLAGRLLRIGLEEGDTVVAGETVVASVDPGAPGLLDERGIAVAEGRLRSAEAGLARANSLVAAAGAGEEMARVLFERLKPLFAKEMVSGNEIDEARLSYEKAVGEREAAESAVEVAEFERDQAKAALMHMTQLPEGTANDWRFLVRAPVDGHVLRVIQESDRMVAPGDELVEIGDPRDLEVVVDVLSQDAVKIVAGAPVRFRHWGGDGTLSGTVRRVEPSAFTKVSALGVEEQRVNVVIDFAEGEQLPSAFGDGFRVEAEIVVWEGDDVVKVPAGALFRNPEGDGWMLYVVRDGRARLRRVEADKSNGLEVQVLSGLEVGETVVLNPEDRVGDGVRVTPRK